MFTFAVVTFWTPRPRFVWSCPLAAASGLCQGLFLQHWTDRVETFSQGWFFLLVPLTLGVAYARWGEWIEVVAAGALGAPLGTGFLVGAVFPEGPEGEFNAFIGLIWAVWASVLCASAALAVVAVRRKWARRRGEILW
jgi:hypothetical protein